MTILMNYKKLNENNLNLTELVNKFKTKINI